MAVLEDIAIKLLQTAMNKAKDNANACSKLMMQALTQGTTLSCDSSSFWQYTRWPLYANIIPYLFFFTPITLGATDTPPPARIIYSKKGIIIELVPAASIKSIPVDELINNEILEDIMEGHHRVAKWPIEALGHYCADTTTITIYTKAIEACSKSRGIDKDKLLKIIQLHEVAHAIVHAGVTYKEFVANADITAAVWDKKMKIYKGFTSEKHEQFAQHFTHYYIEEEKRAQISDHQELLNVFNQLMIVQPPQYKLPKPVIALADLLSTIKSKRL